jgi:hypothetical protein
MSNRVEFFPAFAGAPPAAGAFLTKREEKDWLSLKFRLKNAPNFSL